MKPRMAECKISIKHEWLILILRLVSFMPFSIFLSSKGQIKPKADWQAVDSPKKQTDEFDLFAVKSKAANKTYSSVRFLGEVSRP